MSFQEINAAADLMKLAINNQSHVNSLIGYYRDLIDSFNDERAEWVINFDNVKVTAEDQYLLEKEIAKSQIALEELKQNLDENKSSLAIERQKYFRLMETNGNIKKRLEEAKGNYRELMSSCKPVGLKNKGINASSLGSRDQSMLKDTGNSKTAELQNQLININKEHLQRKRKKKAKIESLKDQLRELISEHQSRSDQCKSEYREALEKLCDLQRKNMALTAEYFRFRNENSEEQKYLQEQSEIIRLKNLAILQRLKSLEKSHEEEFKSVDNEVKKQNKRFKTKYDEQLKNKQQHLTFVKEQHERIQDIYLNKIKKLDQELRDTTGKLKTTEERARIQISSLKSQIKILKGRLEKDAVHQMRDELANDMSEQSSQSLELSELERINQEVKNLEKQMDSK